MSDHDRAIIVLTMPPRWRAYLWRILSAPRRRRESRRWRGLA